MKYLIRVQANMIAGLPIDGDPGRTLVKENARVYSSNIL